MLRFTCIYALFALPAPLFRHALRHATFPKGEGLSARQTEICPYLHLVIFYHNISLPSPKISLTGQFSTVKMKEKE